MTKSPESTKSPFPKNASKSIKAAASPNARKPPVEHRFKAGQSGNPAGRPPGSPNKVTRGRFARMVLEVAERAAPGRPNVTNHRAVLQALYDTAGMGGVGAAELILSVAAKAEAFVADLDEAAEARDAEAAAIERRRSEAADIEAVAARVAAEEPDVYRHALALLKKHFDRPASFAAAIEQARMQIAIGQTPACAFDPHLAAAMAQAKKRKANNQKEGDDDP